MSNYAIGDFVRLVERDALVIAVDGHRIPPGSVGEVRYASRRVSDCSWLSVDFKMDSNIGVRRVCSVLAKEVIRISPLELLANCAEGFE